MASKSDRNEGAPDWLVALALAAMLTALVVGARREYARLWGEGGLPRAARAAQERSK